MPRRTILAVCLMLFLQPGSAQTVSVYQTTPDLLEALSPLHSLRFSAKTDSGEAAPTITVDDNQRFQQIDGIGASLTDAAAWLFSHKLTPEQTEAAFRSIFSRKDGIALSFLRQPIGSSDLAVTFYSYDDLCAQKDTACTTANAESDPDLAHYSLAHDKEYILPLLKQALAINPSINVMLTPWSPPGWMKSSGSMLGSNPETKEPSTLRPEFQRAFAAYLVKTIQGYQEAGIPVFAISVQNEPLYAPPTYSGMQMTAAEQAIFLGDFLAPAMTAANLKTKVMAYDHNWDHPDYPELVMHDPKAAAFVAGTAWHHYAGDPAVMTKFHNEFPQKDEWVTESSGGTWQKGNLLALVAAELIDVTRNWSRSYVLWGLATDQEHGPHVGGCGTCRGLLTIDVNAPGSPPKKEPDYYALGHASKFLLPGAVRIASDEPEETDLRDVAFRNPDGTILLYALNNGTTSQALRIAFHGKTVATVLPSGTVASFVWKLQ